MSNGPYPMQLVVPNAVSAAVAAAITILSRTSQILLFFFIVLCVFKVLINRVNCVCIQGIRFCLIVDTRIIGDRFLIPGAINNECVGFSIIEIEKLCKESTECKAEQAYVRNQKPVPSMLQTK